MTVHLVLDIETVPDPELPRLDDSDRVPPPPFNQVVTLGCLLTWNGRGFDMPVITSRALKHGVSMPWWFSDRHTRYRYSPEGHLDLMDFLSDFGAAKSSPPRRVREAGRAPRQGRSRLASSQVAPMVHAGRIDEVNAYCLCDVAQTAALFLRVQLLRGVIDRARYVTLARGLLAFFDADPRLAPVMSHVDRPRYELESK